MIAFLFVMAGCQTGTLPDPNNVAKAGPNTAETIQRQLESASDALNVRKAKREIDDKQYDALIVKIARDYISQAKDTTITDDNARQWGLIYMTARMWDKAEPALERGIKVETVKAKEDYVTLGYWVGDILNLAGIKARRDKVAEAVQLARSVFNVPPKAKAPILTSVIYSIVPAGVGKGHDLELADLIRDSVAQHQQVIVDPNTDGGRDFLIARPHHIQRAWTEAALLYENSGHHDLAVQALAEAHKEESQFIRL